MVMTKKVSTAQIISYYIYSEANLIEQSDPILSVTQVSGREASFLFFLLICGCCSGFIIRIDLRYFIIDSCLELSFIFSNPFVTFVLCIVLFFLFIFAVSYLLVGAI